MNQHTTEATPIVPLHSDKKTSASQHKVFVEDEDIDNTPEVIEQKEIAKAIEASREAQMAVLRDLARREPPESKSDSASKALRAVIGELSQDEINTLSSTLMELRSTTSSDRDRHPDEVLSTGWREGKYPYRNRMARESPRVSWRLFGLSSHTSTMAFSASC